MKQNKLLILGAKGMLGQALVQAFCDYKEVIAWDIEDLDITDKKLVDQKVTQISPDIIINAVGINAVDKIEEDEAFYNFAKKVNGDAVFNLVDIANQLEIPLVHYSSDYVFDGEGGIDLDELATPNPQSKYAETKLLGEQLATQANKHYVIRLSRLFGNPGLTDIKKRSFIDLMIDVSNKQDSLPGIIDEVASITYAPDLASYTKKLIENKDNKFDYGIYHGANSGSASWYDWAKHIFELKNIDILMKKVSGESFKRAAKRPAYSVLKNTKGPKQRHWKEALKEFLTK